MGFAVVAISRAIFLGISGKKDALELPVCFILMNSFPFESVFTEIDIFIEAPLLKITNPRPPRKITILLTEFSPVQVPAISSVEIISVKLFFCGNIILIDKVICVKNLRKKCF